MSIGDFLGAATPGIIACVIALSKLIDAKAEALQAQRKAQEAVDKADALEGSVTHNAERIHHLENGGTAAIVRDTLARQGLIDRRHEGGQATRAGDGAGSLRGKAKRPPHERPTRPAGRRGTGNRPAGARR